MCHPRIDTTQYIVADIKKTNWKSTGPVAEGEMDHAYTVENPAGATNLPRLSAVIISPLSFPRRVAGTMFVDAIVIEAITCSSS